ncbi:MAG: class I SAM-dependent methyltransferase [Spirochaetales bacterium]|nr:class I SAM-dependent methyltransferase [Spirochaetales bacterium]
MKTFSKLPSQNENSSLIVCPLCGEHKFKALWSVETSVFVKCPKCKLVYQNPQPLAIDVIDRYDETYFKYEIENEKSFLNLILLGLKDIKFDFNPVSSNHGNILDIGCATGLFLEYMKKNGWNTFGVEVCESAGNYANNIRGLDVFIGTIENAPYKDHFFDVIHLSHVIEHITDITLFLESISRVLKPGGVVYCTTPNISGFQAKLFKGKWRSAIPDHMILFSIKTIKKAFRDRGFYMEKHKTWGGLCANSGYPKLIKTVLDKTSKIFGFGDVVIIKALKPTNYST